MLRIGLRVNILPQVVAHVHQHLLINKKTTGGGGVLQCEHHCCFVRRRLGGWGGYLSTELMGERLQEVVVLPVDAEEDNAGRLGRLRVVHDLQERHKAQRQAGDGSLILRLHWD